MQSISLKNKELIRQKIVKWVFVVYWLLIFEGSLRKWVLPQLNQIIFFIRDPFVLLIYWLAWRNKLLLHKSLLLNIGIILAYLSAILMFLQVTVNGLSFFFGFYGWRNYFLYLPLAFIIGKQFNRDDLNRLFKQTLLLSIPVAVLVVLQSLAPPDAVINSGISPDYAFTPLGGGVLRTQGTFTSTLGQTMFVGSIVAILISVWASPSKKLLITGPLLYLTSFAVITNLVVSGSRTAFVITIILVLATIAFSIVLGRQTSRVLITMIIISFFGSLITQTVFSSQFYALVNRADGAAQFSTNGSDKHAVIGSDLFQRTIEDFVRFTVVATQVPVIGIGLGLGGNARSTLGIKLPVNIEDEWSRNILELGPLLGFLFIIYRIAVIVWLFNNAVKAATKLNTLLPILLTTFTSIIFLNGFLTGHGTVNGYGWLFMGFSIATNNLGQVHKEEKNNY